jgi:hypothetical protein
VWWGGGRGARRGEWGRSRILKGCWNNFNQKCSRRSTCPPSPPRRLSVRPSRSPPQRSLPRGPAKRDTQLPAGPVSHRPAHGQRGLFFHARVSLGSRTEISRGGTKVRETRPPEQQQPTGNAVGPMPTPDPVIKRQRPKADGPDPAKLSSPGACVPVGSVRPPEPTVCE